MKVLSKEMLKKAEEILRHGFPQSQQVYGYVFLINRVEADPIDVLVDQWPDFNVLLIRPKHQEKEDFFRDLCIFSKDESSVRSMLIRTDILDWKQFICLSADLHYKEMMKSVAVSKGLTNIKGPVCHQMTLQDPSNLTTERLPLQVSSLNVSHIELVNSKWKFAMGELSKPFIRNMIMNFPSCCLLDSEGQPVSWILTYSSCALGMLYTLPDHRRKGYAKALVTIMAKKLHSEGYPVYCFIEEENDISFRFFTSLGFTEDPAYRAIWLECDQPCS